jgi:hypothetical protein
MSVIKEALDAMREVSKLVDDVKRSTGAIGDLAIEVRDIDRRLSRLEGKWEAVTALGGRVVNQAASPALPSPDEDGRRD